MKKHMTRSEALKSMATGAAILALGTSCGETNASESAQNAKEIAEALKGNINHSVCRWCYKDVELEDLVLASKDYGLKSVELLWPDEYEVATKHDLTCAISFGSKLGIKDGFNDPANHAQLLTDFSDIIPKAADHGITQVICFSGNRGEISDAQGLENCAIGLDPILEIAAKHNIKIVMELLNSKVNHPDYMCDYTEWGVELAEKVQSDNFSLLYDIYHMQIMEGDVISTIRKHHKWISHYHTGGVPGRNEIDDTQELYYPAIMRAIMETGYTGFVGQEFVPKADDPLASLEASIKICDV